MTRQAWVIVLEVLGIVAIVAGGEIVRAGLGIMALGVLALIAVWRVGA